MLWYTIYRIPTDPKLELLNTCFQCICRLDVESSIFKLMSHIQCVFVGYISEGLLYPSIFFVQIE